MRLRISWRLVLVWVLFGMLAACGNAPGSSEDEAAINNRSEELSETRDDSLELDDTHFPVTYEAGGRRENSYSLMFENDPETCSAVLADLNSIRQADVPLHDIRKVTKSTWQDVVIGTRYSIEWTELARKDQRYYREAAYTDIDNDGRVEEVYRTTDETKYGKPLQELSVLEIFGERTEFVTESDPRYYTNELERIIGNPVRNEDGFILYYPNAVRLDYTESTAESFGSFVDVVSIHGKRFILSGGTNPYEEKGVVAPIWLLGLSTSHESKVVCRFQPNRERIEKGVQE